VLSKETNTDTTECYSAIKKKKKKTGDPAVGEGMDEPGRQL
jgi:hypothetical protein